MSHLGNIELLFENYDIVDLSIQNTQDVNSLLNLIYPKEFRIIKISKNSDIYIGKFKRRVGGKKGYFLLSKQDTSFFNYCSIVESYFQKELGLGIEIVSNSFCDNSIELYQRSKYLVVNNYNLVFYCLNVELKLDLFIDKFIFNKKNTNEIILPNK